jgi:MinD-like ATPase involved in chromosome partitioning or flagellar assembly
MKMLELPSYGRIPYSNEVRESFLLKKIKPLLIHNPNCASANSFRAIAKKISGKETKTKEKRKGGFFAFLKRLFSKKK